MASQITATLPTLDFPQEVDYPTQEDWAAFSAAAELNFGILGGSWSTQMQLWKTEANAMSTELNTNATIAQGLANYQGDWISQGYTLGQTVSVSGVYYICKLTHTTGQNPTTGGSLYWNIAIGNWNLKVNNYDNETIAGIKTFTSNIVGNITGNSATATKLATSRTINGVAFDGSANISVGLNTQSPPLSTSFTLDATYKNKVLVCIGTFNITLPTVSTIKSGDLFIINNAGTGILSLVTNGNYTDLSRLTVLAGEVLILQSDGSSFYRFVSRSKDFASNIGNTGYTYLPNGLIMQWGATANIAVGETATITFPIAFTTLIFGANATFKATGSSSDNGLVTPQVNTQNLTGCTIRNYDTDTGAPAFWFAIGY